MHTHTHTYIYIHIHTRVCKRVCVCVCVCVCVLFIRSCSCLLNVTFWHGRACAHTNICTAFNAKKKNHTGPRHLEA